MTEKVEVHCTKPLEVTRFRKPAEYCLIEFKLLLQFTQAGHVTYAIAFESLKNAVYYLDLKPEGNFLSHVLSYHVTLLSKCTFLYVGHFVMFKDFVKSALRLLRLLKTDA